jgi:hypothetical protein
VGHTGLDVAYYYVTAVNWNGGESSSSDTVSGTGSQIEGQENIAYRNIIIPGVYGMHFYPNPFNNIAEIKITVQTYTHAIVILYNIKGQKVMTLCDDYLDPTEIKTINLRGESLSAGIYFCQLRTDKNVINKKIVLLK